MSDTVKLSSKLAADPDLNGLDSLADAMIEDPRQIRVAVVHFDTVKIIDDTDTGARVPYARIRKVEPIGNVDEVPAELAQIVQRATEERTGKAPLPFESVEGISVSGDE